MVRLAPAGVCHSHLVVVGSAQIKLAVKDSMAYNFEDVSFWRYSHPSMVLGVHIFCHCSVYCISRAAGSGSISV